MTAKVKTSARNGRSTAPATAPAIPPELITAATRHPSSPWTAEERLQDIQRMLVRVSEYVKGMLKIDRLQGSSVEAKGKALEAFHEKMIILERQLGRIQEELLLG